MTQTWHIPKANQAGVERLAELIALKLQTDDVIALEGDLGAGKTTFARALIRASLRDHNHEVPSPTFALMQSYDSNRLCLHHLDLYRLEDAEDVDELGLDDLLKAGALVIEWPDRLAESLSENTLTLALTDSEVEDERGITVTARGTWLPRINRMRSMFEFLAARPVWDQAHMEFLQGDASSRSYARLVGGPSPALLMDSPAKPDGPTLKDGKTYSHLAKLAEDVRPFVAIANTLSELGLATPKIHAADLDNGFLVLEDFGDLSFGNALTAGVSQQELWHAAVDVLLELRRDIADHTWTFANGTHYRLPVFTANVMHIEAELLLDWYWPHVTGEVVPHDVRSKFDAICEPLFKRASQSNRHWVLRDYHSPNLIWRPDQVGITRVGVIDFQDALRGPAEYDLVSLLQDARLDVPYELEHSLLTLYLDRVSDMARRGEIDEADIEETKFRYHALGAQRALKILGIFARLANRDAKPGYLKHMPRIWQYLHRNLSHPDLQDLKFWVDDCLQPDVRITPPVS